MNFFKKWYIYQKERFPVITYGLYVFTIVFATFCVNIEKSIPTLGSYVINYKPIIPMFIVAFLQFLMVRIVDEFKDYEEDCKYRPYRPVPRGLITLKELKVLFIICVILQFVITIYVNPKAIIYLIMVWIFFAIMSKGFFMKNYLEKHLLVEVFFDELIMPLCVIYVSALFSNIEFLHIWKFLILTYIVSWLMEIARKTRSKDKEENGVKTYTAVYGINETVFILFVLETILMSFHTSIIGMKNILYAIIPYIIITIINLLFLKKRTNILAKMVQLISSIYVFIVYLSMVLLII